ncbi:hypothetical protein U472_02820 [Orenia metallireducens]|jgi:general secretion pathway protein G|uniref:Prepilin-type N-terminal cleavage/methylation domain-containing protein n=1 Tax=Orenia metallireducens TaxID=1413210 RepID=A0A1C0ACN8_9FIRM|nr:type II secretion system protein [Orenia metallireducens]OCL28139.1 hypothetical protein U472_02820 [Orenia metallireducens]
MVSKIRRMMNSSEEGFTLIELMIVIAILGILAGIAIPKLSGAKTKAKEAKITTVGGTLRTAMEMYFAQEDKYPEVTNYTDLDIELTKVGMSDTVEDLKELITGTNPVATQATYSYTNNTTNDTYQYIFEITAKSTTKYYVGDKAVSTTSSTASNEEAGTIKLSGSGE